MRTVEAAGLPIGDGHPPRIMSVLNMSENSGYKPSVSIDVEEAAAMVDEELVPAGTDIVDVGLQSANPKYETKPPEYELERLAQAAEILDLVETDPVFSLETRYAEVAEEAIAQGFDIVNDVCGFADPEMRPVCEDHDVPVVKMASPPDLDNPGRVRTMDDVFEALQRGGVTDKTIIDPSFGGWWDEDTYERNWEMFRRLREFRAFGCPILTATNREDFLGDLAGRPDTEDQLAVSLAAATMEVERGAHIIRTHDTRETHDVVKVAHALGDDRTVTENSVHVSKLTGVSLREAERHLSLRNRVSGAAAESTSLSFALSGLSQADVETIEAVVADGDLTAATDEDEAFLAGSVTAFRQFLDALPPKTDALVEAAGSIREACHREL